MSSNKDKSTISLVKTVSFDMDDFKNLLKEIYPERKYTETMIDWMWDFLKEDSDEEVKYKFHNRDDYKYNIDSDESFTDEWESMVRRATRELERNGNVFRIRFNKQGKLVLVDPAKEETEMTKVGDEWVCDRHCVRFHYWEDKGETSVEGFAPKYEDGEILDDDVLVIVE